MHTLPIQLLSVWDTVGNQYDGTPMNKTADVKKAETAVRTDKYPHSDNDWENFDVLHINRLPSAATFMAYTTKKKAMMIGRFELTIQPSISIQR